MKTKLIKLSEDHYIIVDDSEKVSGKVGYNEETKKVEFFASHPKYNEEGLKITHSTQPIEVLTALPDYGDGKVTEFKFDKIKLLSLSEAKEAINSYSVEKMADDWFYNEENKNPYENYNEKPAWIKGFKAHQELTKDKLFTIEDLYTFAKFVDRAKPSYKKQQEFIQSLLPKTEWNCIFDEQGKVKIL